MRPVTLPPPGLLFGVTFLPEDFAQRLKHFKAASGLTWDAMAACMGVDPRQLRRWRRGTRPSGDGLFALLTLAARFPGGVHMLLGVSVLLPEADVLEALAGGAGIQGGVPARYVRGRGRGRRGGVGTWEYSSGVHRRVEFDFPRDFPERLALFKEASGLSWKALARLLGVRPYRLWQWRERGVAPSPAHLFLLLTIAESMGLRDGVLMRPDRDMPAAVDLEALLQ